MGETIRTYAIEFDQPSLACHPGPADDELAPADMALHSLGDRVLGRPRGQREPAGHPAGRLVDFK